MARRRLGGALVLMLLESLSSALFLRVLLWHSHLGAYAQDNSSPSGRLGHVSRASGLP